MNNPRRAGQRWLKGAPEYVLDCFDNRGRTVDRYSVLFGGSLFADGVIPCLDMSGSPGHPQGVSMWGELDRAQAAAYRYRVGHDRVRWLDLPEEIRKHVAGRATEA